MSAEQRPRGHREIPHTADIRVEAWAPTREECLAEAVTGLVASFVEFPDLPPLATISVPLGADTDEDLLLSLLDEVIYRLDTTGRVPVTVDVQPARTRLQVRLDLLDVTAGTVVGAAPKAVTLHALEFAPAPDGWRCAVTVDV